VVKVDLLNKNFKTFPALEWSFVEVPFMTCHSKDITPSVLTGDDFLAASSRSFIKPKRETWI
jgi:hypothetical protein